MIKFLMVMLAAVSVVLSASWYVDNAASGTNAGTSWTNAWESFSDIVWDGSGVVADDTIFISGGIDSAIYDQEFDVGMSYVCIMSGAASQFPDGHSGRVVITMSDGDNYGCLKIGNKNHVVVDGTKNNAHNITLRNSVVDGVHIYGDCNNIILINLKICDNGNENNENGVNIDIDEVDDNLVEISYCEINDNYQDQIHQVGPTGLGIMYGRIKIHNCEIYNINDDGVESGGGGIDFYNNIMHDFGSSAATGHPDGVQALSGYLRVYNNYIYALCTPLKTANSYIFFDIYNGSPNGRAKIFGNLCVHTQAAIAPDDYCRGITSFLESGVTDADSVIISNNTIVGMPAWGLTFGCTIVGQTCSNVVVANNIIYNCGDIASCVSLMIDTNASTSAGSWGGGKNITCDYNVVCAGLRGNDDWTPTAIQAHGTTNDPLLDNNYKLSVNSLAINTGVTLNTYYTTDKIGTQWSVPWDIGCYQYGVGTSRSILIGVQR